MYKVIGSDGREYGPVSEEVIRRWIAENRANGETQAQGEGETGWRPLSAFPELAGALAAVAALPLTPASLPTPVLGEATAASPSTPVFGDSSSPSPSTHAASTGAYAAPSALSGYPGGPTTTGAPGPATPAVDADALATALLARDVRFDITGCISRGWDLVQKHFWLTVGAWAICLLVGLGVSSIPYVGAAISILFGAALMAGLHWFFLRLLRGEPAQIGDVFAGFGAAVGPLVLIGVIATILECVGFILCLLPGIYLAVAWHYAPIAALDKGLDFWGAMEVSRKVVTRHWFSVFALFLLAILLWILGLVLCGVGIFVTGPIATAAVVCAYADLFDAGARKPAVSA